ncbi:hypothetical protein [Lacinutrix jangbogonensis]|uniref:hypothetical protein n=1 Tax=Lacinutrix jangbogonensis TaxID=1469557 RepID=UPI00053E7928|nr:hypothetical protein [Lacinutrix jangbogonensis]
MKHYLLHIMFVICSASLFAQHSKAYIEFTNNLVLIDTILINTKFNNGFKKDSGATLVYEYEDYFYEFWSGPYIQYDKKGNIITDSEFDNFGNYLSYTFFDSNGNIIEDYKIKSVDTHAGNLDEFMANIHRNTVSIGYKKKYSYSYKLCKYYLKKEGNVKNFNKIGNWKFYYETGELKKEKTY